MNCPYCSFDGPRRALHAHVADIHPSEVKTTAEPDTGRRFYELQCPFCPQSLRKQIKPRLKDPGFVDEYAREIRLVAFDVLLYHIEEAHHADDQRLQHP
jgi:hypothetical protein